MEDLLLDLLKECSAGASAKFPSVKQSAQEAYNLLSSQNKFSRNPSHELRTICFIPLKLALETKSTKLVALALNGFNRIVRDARFQYGVEPEDDSLWLPTQFLQATASLMSHCEDTQVHILRVLLNLAYCSSWALNGRLVMLLINYCGDAYENGTQAIRAAAQAAASQTLTAFCTFLDEEYQEIEQESKGKNLPAVNSVSCFNEAIPVMQYLCGRIDEQTNQQQDTLQIFLLECLLTLVNSLPKSIQSNGHFTTFLWQKFCPSLLSFLSGKSTVLIHQRIIYNIGMQVVRLVGTERPLRPVLEAFFHRILLLPNPVKRLEPLKTVRELLRNPNRIIDLVLLTPNSEHINSDDLALIRLIMDSIEECAQYDDPNLVLISLECIDSLLGTLQALARGENLNLDVVNHVNQKYPNLESVDYTGPLTYQYLARLPKSYRDAVVNMKCCNDSSESSGIEGTLQDYETDSGATEEYYSQSDISFNEELISIANNTNPPQINHNTNKESTFILDDFNVELERDNARHFFRTLHDILVPKLWSLRSSIQVDEIIQEFASKCCQQYNVQYQKKTSSIALNADGIYLTIYQVLLLDLKLITNQSVKMESEEEFLHVIRTTDALQNHLSTDWLKELYQNTVKKSILIASGYKNTNPLKQPVLINLLNDLNVSNDTYLLSDWEKFQRLQTKDGTEEIEAGTKLSRRILTCCWSSLITVLELAFNYTECTNPKVQLSVFGTAKSKHKIRQKLRDNLKLVTSEALHKLARLSIVLKLKKQSDSVFALLSKSCCKLDGDSISASKALSLDVLLSQGLELGANNSKCWTYVFNGVLTVAQLEKSLLTKTGETQILMVAQNPNENRQKNIVTSSNRRLPLNYFNAEHLDEEEEVCIDIYNFLPIVLKQQQQQSNGIGQNTSVLDVLTKLNRQNSLAILKGVQTAKICTILKRQVDELFHLAAAQFTLPNILGFLRELCEFSQNQQLKEYEEREYLLKKTWWRKSISTNNSNEKNSLNFVLLQRIGEVARKSIRSGRPLIHMMKMWSIISPYLVATITQSPNNKIVAKKALNILQDLIVQLLNDQMELVHFHINEKLLEPYQILLVQSNLETEIRLETLNNLCSLIEMNRNELGSGWKPIFAALKTAQYYNSGALLGIFKGFLEQDSNGLIFTNAALNYINCLLAFCIKWDLSCECLKLLEKSTQILGAMYTAPQYKFNLIQVERIQRRFVEIPFLCDSDDSEGFDLHTTCLSYDCDFGLDSIEDFDTTQTGVLHVWYLLLDGLTTAVLQKNQSGLTETLFKLIRNLIERPGIEFGYYCINHLVLPMLQMWLRMANCNYQNFKHTCGLTCELIMHYFHCNNVICGANLALKQLLNLLLDCIRIPINENLVRLSTSCVRHLILSAGRIFTNGQWDSVLGAIWRASLLTLEPLHELCGAFQEDSDSFYGDYQIVKVAARRDSSRSENERLIELAQQVFLMQTQKVCHICQGKICDCIRTNHLIDDRSYAFLLYNPRDSVKHCLNPPDGYRVRIPFRNLVLGLLTHQILIQTVTSLLLQNLKHIQPVLHVLQVNNCTLRNGIFENLEPNHYHIIVKILELSNERGIELDQRPGLKFLLQKVGHLDKAANLYTQSNTANLIEFIVLIDQCLDALQSNPIDLDHVLRNTCDNDRKLVEYFCRRLQRKWIVICEDYLKNPFVMKLSNNTAEHCSYEDTQNDPNQEAFTLRTNCIKYDTNTLMQIQMPRLILLPQSDTSSLVTGNSVPQEIEQQRINSILKDSEHYKVSILETLEACLELINSLEDTDLVRLGAIFQNPTLDLIQVSDEKIQKISQTILDRVSFS